ncbi:unnamed protein product [Ceutorhynchus assimilis]|uniref:SWIM-type domain-containing protein n=2 Tax=Ceutorhynchus assimilis TaxID=467358 RepID=A0A9N9MFN5_9CUCU|nr:unnamed protein product [Ceutorhynchus assimilis]
MFILFCSTFLFVLFSDPFVFKRIMAFKHVLKLSSINAFIDDNKIIKRGENALESSHVKKMEFDSDLQIIRGEVFASMKDKSYKVSIVLEQNGDIREATCICPRGIKCHHIAALALFGHYRISVTDKACAWNAPPKPKDGPVKCAEELYPPKPYTALEGGVPEASINRLKERLRSFGNTVGFTWLLNEESINPLENRFAIIEEIISSKDFLEATDKVSVFRQKCAVDDHSIKDIAATTTGQVSNEKWFLVRKFRLTASNFGAIIAACQRNRFPVSLFKTLLGEYNLDGIKAIQWGRTHEKDALDHLKSNYNLNIRPTGVWLSNSGLLGASPDGLIDEEEAIVEVKCPYSLRNNQLSEKLKNLNKYIIFYDDEGNLMLNTNHHNYYHQIQGALHILKKEKCYLCIYTLKETIVTVIEFDDSWKENLSVLENFYIKQYLPKLLEN